MRAAKKLLLSLFVMVWLISTISGTAFAAEASQPTLGSSVGETDDTNVPGSDTASEETPSDDDVYVDDQGQVHDKGAIVDEQGQVIDTDAEADASAEEDTNKDDAATNDKAADDKKDNDNSKKSNEDDKDKSDSKKHSYSDKDLRLLSCLIFSEAGGQPYEGMLGVANVVLNRVKSDVYWHVNTVEEVIYDHKWSVQFAVTIKDRKTGISPMDKALRLYDSRKYTGPNPEAQKKSMEKAIKAAKAALEGENNIGGFLCFQNKRYASSIRKKYPDYKIIGDHLFYRTK